MSEDQQNPRAYAHLPEDLLIKILESVPVTVDKMNQLFDIQDEPIANGIAKLRDNGLISKNLSPDFTGSLIAVDGGQILEKMTGTDILLAVAVGVEGLSSDPNSGWVNDKNQFYQWQTVLPHDEANARLCQGVMHLMELSVLANAEHEIRIMDGTHFTPLIKVNSLLSAKEESAGKEYINALKDFLKETYDKIIPDIPDIVRAALQNDKIVAIVKYSSSRDIIDAYLTDESIKVDDKTFFSLGLEEDEYLKPMSVGQSKEERRKIWDDLHIKCNLVFEKDSGLQKKLTEALQEIVEPIRTKIRKSGDQESDLFFTYYKPYADGPAYRIEVKRSLAKDIVKFERCLLSIKRQIVFPQIREPYPQFLVDLMAKSVAGGLFAIQEAIKLSPDLKLEKGKFNLLFNYRT